MTRSCSHCTPGGHTSRSCTSRGVKLFGFRLTTDGSPGSIRKSASMGNLTHYEAAGLGSDSGGQHCGELPEHGTAADGGYASEDLVPGPASSCRQRKKGTPWTQEEHRMFLIGLQKLGKGDWRGISRNFVISRTPTQVASHAQKYFIRQTNVSRRRRRSSLFDIVADEPVDAQVLSQELLPANQPQSEAQNSLPLPTPPVVDEECESMDSSDSNKGQAAFLPFPQQDNSPSFYPVVFPTYYSPFLAFPLPLWHEPSKMETHEVLKPTAIHSKNPINVDELVGMSKLSLENSSPDPGPSTLSLKLHGGSTRQSAFHASPSTTSSGMNSSNSAIHAV